MADRARKGTELPTRTFVNANDIVIVVANTSNTPNTYGVRVGNFFTNCDANVTLQNAAILSVNTAIIRKNSTPANSTITVTQGTMWSDGTYLYVATADNTLKRVALSAF